MDTHCGTAFQSFTAIQRDTTLYSIQLYIGVHGYILYIVTQCILYTIQPLHVQNLYNTPPLGARGAPRARCGRARESAKKKEIEQTKFSC